MIMPPVKMPHPHIQNWESKCELTRRNTQVHARTLTATHKYIHIDIYLSSSTAIQLHAYTDIWLYVQASKLDGR